ncbi:MAG: dual specificity protein phosphatase family protein [Acidobacteria bacterium]|nr:dual specificity protein phosphatase family protein [Acidobacteriota bacterium]MBS1864703.1 dual specificity protein phosphatase family protein [Acidobacteriota bacterium]
MKLSFTFALFVISLYAVPPQSPPPEKILCSTISAPHFGEKLKLPGLPNGGKIDDSLLRGAQPHAEGFPELKKLGVTTIVDLRGDNSHKLDWERKQAESIGIRFLNIPVSGWSPPTNDQIAQFLSLFKNPHERVFVHCRFGDDRTGVFVAAYRIAHDSWSADHAVKEMYFFGFNGFWHPAMKSFINDFPEKLKAAPVLAPFASKL